MNDRRGPGAEPMSRLLEAAVSRRGFVKGVAAVAAALTRPGDGAAQAALCESQKQAESLAKSLIQQGYWAAVAQNI